MIDKNKTYKTRDGKEVRIYATDGKKDFEVHGAIKKEDFEWDLARWDIYGRVFSEGKPTHYNDLIEVKPKIKGWVNFYPNNVLWNKIYETKEEADYGATRLRIACIEVEFTEGDGI